MFLIYVNQFKNQCAKELWWCIFNKVINWNVTNIFYSLNRGYIRLHLVKGSCKRIPAHLVWNLEMLWSNLLIGHNLISKLGLILMTPIQVLLISWGEQNQNHPLKNSLSEETCIVLSGPLEKWINSEYLSLDHTEKIQVKLLAHHQIQPRFLKKVGDNLQNRIYCLMMEIVANISIITTFLVAISISIFPEHDGES